MKVSKQATVGHLIIGVILVSISLVFFIINLFIPQDIYSFLIFFLGVWGGVELGRYLEFILGNQVAGPEDKIP